MQIGVKWSLNKKEATRSDGLSIVSLNLLYPAPGFLQPFAEIGVRNRDQSLGALGEGLAPELGYAVLCGHHVHIVARGAGDGAFAQAVHDARDGRGIALDG
jgi:hypothetical protein